MSLLNVENLTVGYYMHGVIDEVLKNVSFNVEKGEIFGIVGESGSGKTTLALSIMRLLAGNAVIQSGKVQIGNENLLSYRKKDMADVRGSRIGMIFQDPLNALNPVYTVGFQVKESIKAHLDIKSKRKLNGKVKEALRKVKLKDVDNLIYSYPHQLSGGMRQRVMIAQAISCNPSVLIADEPTSNLDVTIQKQILDLFIELKEEFGFSIVLISHDLDLINYTCNRVTVLNRGKIEETGKTGDVFEEPETEYTKTLIKSNNFFKI